MLYLDPYRQNFRFCRKSAFFFFGGGCIERDITLILLILYHCVINTIATKSMESPEYLKAT